MNLAILLGQTTTAPATTPLPLAVWIVLLVALIVGGAGRRWLPLGAADGLFMVGVSGLLIALYAGWQAAEVRGFALGAALLGMAGLWTFVAHRVEVDTPASDAADRERHAVRRHLAHHAAILAAALVLPALFAAAPTVWLGRTLVLVIGLFAVGGWYFSRGRTALTALALVAPVLIVLAALGGAAENRLAGAWYALALGAAALAVQLGTVLADWRRRRQLMTMEPARLLAPPPRRTWLGRLVWLLAGATLAGAAFVSAHPTLPIALAFAALALLGLGHRRRRDLDSAAGLLLAALSVVAAGTGWVDAGPTGLLLGTLFAGLWMTWLNRFWHQQLDDERPWTSAGRLVPFAGRWGVALTVPALALAALLAGIAPAAAIASNWLLVFLALVALLHASMLIRHAAWHVDTTEALAGCVAWTTAAALICTLVWQVGYAGATPVVLAGAALGLTLRVLSPPAALAWVYRAYALAFLPLAALLIWTRLGAEVSTPSGVTVAALLAANLLATGLIKPRMPVEPV